jgi:hypothetical protein
VSLRRLSEVRNDRPNSFASDNFFSRSQSRRTAALSQWVLVRTTGARLSASYLTSVSQILINRTSGSAAISRGDSQLSGRVGASLDFSGMQIFSSARRFGKMQNFSVRRGHVRARLKEGDRRAN